MLDAVVQVPAPINEPVLSYAPGTAERQAVKAALAAIETEVVEIPCVIAGQRVTTGRLYDVVMPHRHRHVIARFHCADAALAEQAARAALIAQHDWAALPWSARAAVLLKAADLLAGPWRARINAVTMHGQSKTAHQAEIDAACELIDFWRFSARYAQDLYAVQPHSAPGAWNMLDLRPLEGFVLALTPFNFTAIGGNLAATPTLLGNTVVWKPAESATLAAWEIFQLLEEAGLPPGVLNFLPGLGQELAPPLMAHRDLAALNFTGSTDVFRSLWKIVGDNLAGYRTYPRLIGETGGKDFVLAHASADPKALVTALVRGAFEYQGQKCSAASRAFIPATLWSAIKDELVATTEGLTVGDVADFSNFMGAVIKQSAFDRHAAAIAEARTTHGMAVLAGGQCDGEDGWFVRPTILTAEDPGVRHLRDEMFGPILTVHVYPDHTWADVLELVDRGTPYALTGAVFAQDRAAIVEATRALRHAAGNFYINDKPTGAVVGQQPFGGGRASGTNDKAGSPHYLLRLVSARTIKETLVPPTDYRYPFLARE